jgi:hypothetical protein
MPVKDHGFRRALLMEIPCVRCAGAADGGLSNRIGRSSDTHTATLTPRLIRKRYLANERHQHVRAHLPVFP